MNEPFDPNTIPGLFDVPSNAWRVHEAINKQLAAVERDHPGKQASLYVNENGQTFLVDAIHDDDLLVILTCRDEEGRFVKLIHSHSNLCIRMVLSEKR